MNSLSSEKTYAREGRQMILITPELLRRLRIEAGLTQAELAERARSTRGTLRRFSVAVMEWAKRPKT
jgi:hypothetical protein